MGRAARLRHSTRVLGTGLVVAWLAACQLLVTLDTTEAASDAAAESGPPLLDAGDAGPEASRCGRRPPPRGSAEASTSGAPQAAYYFVLPKTITATEAGTGFDLDCIDTTCEGPGAGALGCRAAPNARFCDQPNGVDDYLHVAAANNNVDLATSSYEKRVKLGVAGIVVGVLGYNGEADDPDVGFTIFPTGGIRALGGCDPDAAKLPAVEDASFPPSFDGCDLYFGDPEFVGGSRATPLSTVHGYVVGGRLVADEPLTALLPYAGRYVESVAMVVQATLSKRTSDGRFELTDGIIGGRINAPSLLALLGEQPQGTDYVCHDPVVWPIARQRACAELDLAVEADADPSQPCGAISFAAPFSAVPIQLSDNTKPRVDLPRNCADIDAQDFICP